MSALRTRAIGAPLARLDGPAKVTGTATYAFESGLGDGTLRPPAPPGDQRLAPTPRAAAAPARSALSFPSAYGGRVDVRGGHAGLDLLGQLEADERVAGDHRLHAVRAHLLEMAGDRAAARDSYRAAARRTTSFPQQRYLHARAARLTDDQ
jgi:hypothetical protein